jgi:CheY-like chemotaxis protein
MTPPSLRTMNKILLIEDNPDLMESVSSVLRTTGYDVLQSTDGRDGLAKAQQDGPDLILTDLMLPQLNGYEICAMLKQDVRYRKIPIIIWSATKMQDTDAKMALECGADEWALKTIGPQVLLETIKRLLDARGAAA